MARLAPLIYQSLEKNRAVALFSDCPMPVLPSAVEVNPISALSEALGWVDFLACDIPFSDLPVIKTQLKDLLVWEYQGIPGQVLCSANLPCVGLADCGVCSVYAGREWKLACKDGPVFDLQQLLK